MGQFIQDILAVTRKQGFNPIVGDIHLKQQQWYSWFRGDVNGFHTFKQSVNGTLKEFERQTMNMPKKICEDFHSLIWNEQCEIKIKNPDTDKLVEEVLKNNNFDVEFGNIIETSFGMGMGYMVQYLEEGDTKIKYINFENALPIEWDNSIVKALLTIDIYKSEDSYITHLMYQYFENDRFIVDHKAFVSSKSGELGVENPESLATVYSGIQRMEVSGIKYPFFQVVRPNSANHFEMNNPYSVSIYSTMLGYFKILDTLFDMYQTEANNNRTRIIVDGSLLQVKEVTMDSGELKHINYFDENDTALFALPFKDSETEQKAIEFFQGTFQFESLSVAIDKILKLVGFRAGLGKNFYSFSEGTVNYQNEKAVVTSNSDTYRSKKKHEKYINKAIVGLINSILEIETIAGRYKGNIESEEIEIIFDDSIAQDDEGTKKELLELVDKGMVPKYYALAIILKITDEEAKALVAEVEADEAKKQAEMIKQYEDDDDDEDEPTPTPIPKKIDED